MKRSYPHTDLLSVLTTFLAISVYVFVSLQFLILLQDSPFYSNSYRLLQAIGAIVFGFLSDRFCRRQIALLVQFVALFSSITLLFFPSNIFFIMLSGFFYNPLSIFRASLVDNIPHMSKVQLIAYSFIAQILPFSFFHKLANLHPDFLIKSSACLLILTFLASLLFFRDKRDKLTHNAIYFNTQEIVHPLQCKRFLLTFLAYSAAQSVNFFTSNLLGNYASNAILFATLSTAAILGAFVAILYKKTPHVSVLTVNYGISVLVTSIPIICIAFYNYQAVPIPLELIIFASLSSFGLPFVYDILLSSANAYYRGFTCGLLEALYSLSTIISAPIVYALRVNILPALFVILALFLTSTLIQRQSE